MPPAEPGHAHGIHHLRPRHALAHRKADYLPVEQLDRRGKYALVLDAPRGFEPRLTESESVVLPLDDRAGAGASNPQKT